MIKSFLEFKLTESVVTEIDRLFIYQRKFRLSDLLGATVNNKRIYSNKQIDTWMLLYNLDDLAGCVFVTKTPSKNTGEGIEIRTSEKDIKNKKSFTPTKKYKGYLPEDSKFEINGTEIYLFIFKKNSNKDERSRQNHGFIYEGEVRRGNNLTKYDYTHKWDAEGTLDKSFLDDRASVIGKTCEFFDGSKYKSITIPDPINGLFTVDFDKVPDNFKRKLYWNIKCMKNRTDIEMGDFKRVAGLQMVDGKIKLSTEKVENFMFVVGFHSGSPNYTILTEYIILMSVDEWKKLLPDLTNLQVFQELYDELSAHRLKGDRTEMTETAWLNFRKKYAKLAEKSSLKLRFKRDSKGQLRIQSAFSNETFMKEIVAKRPHIRISSKLP
jgi:hypothetical protein